MSRRPFRVGDVVELEHVDDTEPTRRYLVVRADPHRPIYELLLDPEDDPT